MFMCSQGIVSEPALASDDDVDWYHEVLSTLTTIQDSDVRKLLLKYAHLKDAFVAADTLALQNQDSSSDADDFQPDSPPVNSSRKRARVALGERR